MKSDFTIDELSRYVLKENVVKINGKYMFTANPGNEDNYYALWTRDAVYCILAALTTEDELLMQASLDSFRLLHEYQTDLGRIPAYISLKDQNHLKAEFGGWGRIETLDSQMWYVIAAKKIYEATKDDYFISEEVVESLIRAVDLLNYRTAGSEPENLVDWPLSSGWADQMHRHHHVTSLESLRVAAINSLIYLLKISGEDRHVEEYKKRSNNIMNNINNNLWLTKENVGYLFINESEEYGPGYFSVFAKDIAKEVNDKSEEYQFYQSYLAPFKISKDHLVRFDSYGNLLAVLTGVATSKRSKMVVEYIINKKINDPYPLKTLFPVIKKGDYDYDRFYSAVRNSPYSYQNGGIWPHISSMYIRALILNGMHEMAKSEFSRICDMVLQPGKINEYSFSEYYHGDTGNPGKRAHEHQAWSAAGIIYSKYLLENRDTEFF